MLAGLCRVDGQWNVDEQFGKEEVAAGLAVQQQGVFADPAEPGLLGDGFFQHRGTVDKGAKAKGANSLLDTLGQLLNTLADQLVIVAAQGVAGNVRFSGCARRCAIWVSPGR